MRSGRTGHGHARLGSKKGHGKEKQRPQPPVTMLRTDDASGHGSLRSGWPQPGREPCSVIAACTQRRGRLGRYRAKGEEKAAGCPPGGEAPRHRQLESRSSGGDGPVGAAPGDFNADSWVVTPTPGGLWSGALRRVELGNRWSLTAGGHDAKEERSGRWAPRQWHLLSSSALPLNSARA